MKRVNSMNSVPKKNTSLLQKAISLVLLIFLAGCLMTGSVVAEKSTNEITMLISGMAESGNMSPVIPLLTSGYVMRNTTGDYLYLKYKGAEYLANSENMSRLFTSSMGGFHFIDGGWFYKLPDNVDKTGHMKFESLFDSSGCLNHTSGVYNPPFITDNTNWNYFYSSKLSLYYPFMVNKTILILDMGSILSSNSVNVNSEIYTGNTEFFVNGLSVPDNYSLVGFSLTENGDKIIASLEEFIPEGTVKDLDGQIRLRPAMWSFSITSSDSEYHDPSGKFSLDDNKWISHVDEGKVTLYAVWEKKTPTENRVSGSTILIINQNHVSEPDYVESHRVAFHANGGIGEMEVQKFTEDVPQKLMLNAFTRDGYDFVGWAVNPDESVVYTDGQEITVTEDITLYAVWSEIPPRVPVWLIPLCVIFVLAACVVTCFAVWKRRK